MPDNIHNRERLLKVVNEGGGSSGIASWGIIALFVFLLAVNVLASPQSDNAGEIDQHVMANKAQNGERAAYN